MSMGGYTYLNLGDPLARQHFLYTHLVKSNLSQFIVENKSYGSN